MLTKFRGLIDQLLLLHQITSHKVKHTTCTQVHHVAGTSMWLQDRWVEDQGVTKDGREWAWRLVQHQEVPSPCGFYGWCTSVGATTTSKRVHSTTQVWWISWWAVRISLSDKISGDNFLEPARNFRQFCCRNNCIVSFLYFDGQNFRPTQFSADKIFGSKPDFQHL